MDKKHQPLGSENSTNAVAKNSLHIVIAQILGLGFGLLFDILLASSFGVGETMDAVFVALVIPQIIFSVFVSIGIRVFSPLLSEAYSKGGEALLSTIFSSVANYMFLLLLTLAMIGFMSSSWITSIFGLSQSVESITAQSFRILCFTLLPLGLIELIKSLLVNQGHFFLSSLSSLIRYGAAVIVLLLFRNSYDVLAVPWAYIAGAYGQLIIYIAIFIFWFPHMYRFTFGKKEKALSQLINRLGPPVVGELVGQSNVLIEVYFASYLSPGVVSVFGYGRRFLSAANGLISNSVVVATIPQLSREAIANNIANLRKTILISIQLISLVTGFFIVVLIGSGKMFEVLLLATNKLPDQQSVRIAVMLLMVLGPSLFFIGIAQVFVAPFYAYGETKIIMYLRILFFGVNFLITYILVLIWQAEGLVFALVASLFIQSISWFYMISKRLEGLGKEIYTYLTRFILFIIPISLLLYILFEENLFMQDVLFAVGMISLLSVFAAISLFLFAVRSKVFSLTRFTHFHDGGRNEYKKW